MSVMHEAKVLIGKALRPIHAGDKKLTSKQEQTAAAHTITVTSSVFSHGAKIPHSCAAPGEGENVSPQLSWSGVPAGAKSLALICEDPDAPMLNPFIHWIIYNIPAETTQLPNGVEPVSSPAIPAGAKQAKNSAKVTGYYGPLPPPGHGVHHYHFQLFALSGPITLTADVPDRNDLITAMTGKVVAVGELIGTYERN